MGTDPNPQDPPAKGDQDPKPGDKPDPADGTLGDGGKKALEAERKARRDAEQLLKDTQAKLQEIEDKDKTESDRLREENAKLTAANTELTTSVARLEVAAEKGVKPRWLTGTTREELEAAADEYLADHPPTGGATPPPSQKPSPNLQGGTDPTAEGETLDPAKLAEAIPRP